MEVLMFLLALSFFVIGLIYFVKLIFVIFNWKKIYCPMKFNGWTKSIFEKHIFTDWYHQDYSQPEYYDYEEWEERVCKCCGKKEQREIPFYKELEK